MFCKFILHLQFFIESDMSGVAFVVCVNEVNVIADIPVVEEGMDAGETLK